MPEPPKTYHPEGTQSWVPLYGYNKPLMREDGPFYVALRGGGPETRGMAHQRRSLTHKVLYDLDVIEDENGEFVWYLDYGKTVAFDA